MLTIFPGKPKAAARALLGDLLAALRPSRLHFGWRTIDDCLDLLVRLPDAGAIPRQMRLGKNSP